MTVHPGGYVGTQFQGFFTLVPGLTCLWHIKYIWLTLESKILYCAPYNIFAKILKLVKTRAVNSLIIYGLLISLIVLNLLK